MFGKKNDSGRHWHVVGVLKDSVGHLLLDRQMWALVAAVGSR